MYPTNPLFIQLQKYVIDTKSLLVTMSEDEVLHPKHSSKWNKKEILGHLIDSGINNYRRFLTGSISQKLVFEGYDQDIWVKKGNYLNESWSSIVDSWYVINKRIIKLLDNISPDLLNKKIEIHNLDSIGFGQFEPKLAYSLEDFVSDYISHLKHHIDQIIY